MSQPYFTKQYPKTHKTSELKQRAVAKRATKAEAYAKAGPRYKNSLKGPR